LLIFMSFFTLLTFILALTNPVSDCGCFGDALKLTNWQTFWKNVILLVPTILIFLNRRKFIHKRAVGIEWALSGMNFMAAVFLSLYCIRHQPLLDFRPYTIGASIPENMMIPEGAPADKYETMLIYEKNGVKQQFTETDFPWQDSTWKWVETRQELISKGYEPPIHDFSITSESGLDITDSVLKDTRYALVIISPFLNKAPAKAMQRMNDLALRFHELGFPVYCLTASTTTQIAGFKTAFQPAFEICTTDETTLKTIIRANPGLLLLREGIILGKWNHTDAPEASAFHANPISLVLDIQRRKQETSTVIILALACIVFYALVYFLLPLPQAYGKAKELSATADSEGKL